jgi:hypothetical protein
MLFLSCCASPHCSSWCPILASYGAPPYHSAVYVLLCLSTCLQLVREIGQRGLRNLSTSKNPEASLTGALSREVLFQRLKPGTYALQVGQLTFAIICNCIG